MPKMDWDLADKIYAREEDKILEDTNKKEQEITRDCTKGGIFSTTPWLSEIHIFCYSPRYGYRAALTLPFVKKTKVWRRFGRYNIISLCFFVDRPGFC